MTASRAQEIEYSILPVRLLAPEASPNTVPVRLVEGGRVLVLKKTRWVAVTLDGLSKHLAESAKRYHEEQKALGKVGFETVVGGGRVARQVVAIDAHPETPWRHFGWVANVCRECQFIKVQLRVGDASIRLVLPPNSSAVYRPIPEARQLHVCLGVEGPPGRPRVRYGVEGRATRKPATAVRFLDEEIKRSTKASISVVAIPTIEPAVSLAASLAILLALRELGVRDADFGRVLHDIPDDPDRTTTVLPSPPAR